MLRYYVLHNKTPVPCTLLSFVDSLPKNRIIRHEHVGKMLVSTVFLGMDHSWGHGPPQLFETMIFEGPYDGAQWRYATYEEAEDMHGKIVAALQAGTPPPH